jgi:hypothetical protein
MFAAPHHADALVQLGFSRHPREIEPTHAKSETAPTLPRFCISAEMGGLDGVVSLIAGAAYG